MRHIEHHILRHIHPVVDTHIEVVVRIADRQVDFRTFAVVVVDILLAGSIVAEGNKSVRLLVQTCLLVDGRMVLEQKYSSVKLPEKDSVHCLLLLPSRPLADFVVEKPFMYG